MKSGIWSQYDRLYGVMSMKPKRVVNLEVSAGAHAALFDDVDLGRSGGGSGVLTVGEAAAVVRIGRLLRVPRAGLEAMAGGALRSHAVEATADDWPAAEPTTAAPSSPACPASYAHVHPAGGPV